MFPSVVEGRQSSQGPSAAWARWGERTPVGMTMLAGRDYCFCGWAVGGRIPFRRR